MPQPRSLLRHLSVRLARLALGAMLVGQAPVAAAAQRGTPQGTSPALDGAHSPLRLLIPTPEPGPDVAPGPTGAAGRDAPEDALAASRPGPEDPRRMRLVRAAGRLLEQGASFKDCSSFVQQVFRAAGESVTPVPLPRGRSLSESLFRAAHEVDAPRPGDIAVFHNTYDANRDGRRNDSFTHISLVESVDGDVVTLIHRGGRGLARHRMNLSAPDDHSTNSPLRRVPRGSRMRVLAGQLFAGYGDLLAIPSGTPAELTPRESS